MDHLTLNVSCLEIGVLSSIFDWLVMHSHCQRMIRRAHLRDSHSDRGLCTFMTICRSGKVGDRDRDNFKPSDMNLRTVEIVKRKAISRTEQRPLLMVSVIEPL